MLLCRVTVGTPSQGKPGIRRPPINFETQDLYDCVYGYIRTYNFDIDLMYAIFDNYQSYPEYIISFKNNINTTFNPITRSNYYNYLPGSQVQPMCKKCHVNLVPRTSYITRRPLTGYCVNPSTIKRLPY